MPDTREPIARLPVFGWQAFAGARKAALPCLLDLPGLHYTTSGRASILLALEALGVGPGHRVLLPTYHCPTMVAPAVELGAVPVFYPLDAHGAPDLAWLETANLQGVRVLLAAHFFGLPQPMSRVRDWCSRHGIRLIEDCAHALFGTAGAKPIGAWGDVAIASLTKFLPVPEGGCLIVNQGQPPQALARCGTGVHVKAAIDILDVGARQGQLTGLNSLINGAMGGLRALRGRRSASRGPPPVEATVAPPNTAAAAGTPAATFVSPMADDFYIDAPLAHRDLARPCRWVAVALPRQRIVERRRAHYAELTRRLSGHTGLHPLVPDLPAEGVPYVFPLWVDEPDPGYAELRRLRMPVFRWERLWPSVPHIPGDMGRRWSHHIIQLACHQDLSPADLGRFVQALLKQYAR